MSRGTGCNRGDVERKGCSTDADRAGIVVTGAPAFTSLLISSRFSELGTIDVPPCCKRKGTRCVSAAEPNDNSFGASAPRWRPWIVASRCRTRRYRACSSASVQPSAASRYMALPGSPLAPTPVLPSGVGGGGTSTRTCSPRVTALNLDAAGGTSPRKAGHTHPGSAAANAGRTSAAGVLTPSEPSVARTSSSASASRIA